MYRYQVTLRLWLCKLFNTFRFALWLKMEGSIPRKLQLTIKKQQQPTNSAPPTPSLLPTQTHRAQQSPQANDAGKERAANEKKSSTEELTRKARENYKHFQKSAFSTHLSRCRFLSNKAGPVPTVFHQNQSKVILRKCSLVSP